MSAEPGQRFRIGEVPPLAEGFTGRPDTAGGVAVALVPGSAVALVPGPAPPIEGLPTWSGASGKSQIAVMIAESLWRSHVIDALIWISVTSRAAVLSGFVQASVATTGLEATGTAESVAVRFVSWLAETRWPWLVVLDDLSGAVDLGGLWPAGPAGRVLITGARPPAVRGIRIVTVGPFSVREALNGLTERLSVNPVQRQGAIDLVETLGREPLALAHAASVLASSNLTCRDYRELFLARRNQMWPGVGQIPSAAMVTWILSLERAESLLPGPPVRLMLVFVALLDGHGIPGTLFGTRAALAYLGAVGPRQAWDALLAIERVGLIVVNRGVTPPTIVMSPSVQAAIRLAAPAEAKEPAARAAASALLEAWPAAEPHPWTAVGLRANAAGLQESAADALWTDGCHPLLLRLGRSLDEARLAGSAVELWRDLAARCDARLPPGHRDTLAVAARLAAAYLAAGNATEAVQWYQRVLAERTREPDATRSGHPAIVAARVSLARALITAGEPQDAVTVLLHALSESEQSRGPEHPDTLAVREELATAYQAAGDPAAAAELLARGLADRERIAGPRDALTMATRDRLAAARLAEGRTKDAISQYKQVLSDREKVLGRDDPDTIATAASLSAAYRAAGRMPNALQLAERCCADSQRVLGPDHADTLSRLARLAHLYYAVGRVGDAAAVLRETAARCEQTLPPGDPLIATIRLSLANIGDG